MNAKPHSTAASLINAAADPAVLYCLLTLVILPIESLVTFEINSCTAAINFSPIERVPGRVSSLLEMW